MIRPTIILLMISFVYCEVLHGPLKSKRVGLKNCESGKRLDCADCLTVKICSYDETVITQYRCMDVDPATPYCNGAGECSSLPDLSQTCVKPDDLCPRDAPGFYPDPTNCTRYLYCDENKISYPQNCLAGNNVYNQSSASCFLKRRSSDCFQVDCKNTRNKGKWFIYTPFPQLYFFCSENGPLLFKCARQTDVFNVNTRRCEFQCPTVGRFEYPDVPNMYYECVEVSSSKIEKFVQYCPFTLTFDAKEQKCVLEKF